MRARQLPIPLVVVLALGLTTIAPARAVTVTTSTLPAELSVLSTDCTGLADGTVGTVPNPDGITGGTGAGSLKLHQGDVTDVVGISRAFDLLSTLSSVTFDYYDPDVYGTFPADNSTWLDIRVTTANGTFHLLQFPDGGPGWQTHQATPSSTYAVVQEVTGGWSTPILMSMTTFLATDGDGSGAVRIVRAPCYAGYAEGNPMGWTPPPSIGADTYLDLVQVSFTGQDAPTYDFEDHVLAATIARDHAAITAGDAAKISGVLTRDGVPFAGVTVDLAQRPTGQVAWTTVGSAKSGAGGGIALIVHPRRTTDYRWTYPTTGMTSPVARVGVRTRLTLGVADATLKPGQHVLVSGRTTPAKPGTHVTVWRRTTSGRVALGTATVGSGGAYTLTRTLRSRGTYRIWATVPATDGNLAGTSPTRTVTVS